MAGIRIRRVEELLQRELAKILAYDLRDPRVRFASVTHVSVSGDLSDAIVYVSFLEDDPARAKETLEALDSAQGYIKRLLAQRVVLRRLPDLDFRHDTSINKALNVYRILDEVRPEQSVQSSSENGAKDEDGAETP